MKRILIVLAAGVGSRMEKSLPKQYLKLNNGLSILDTTILRLLHNLLFDLVVIVLNPEDNHWKESIHNHNPNIKICFGGKERSESVYNALILLKDFSRSNDWIFVHDSVRPCINISDIIKLCKEIHNKKAIGGILSTRLYDTVKILDVSNQLSLQTLNTKKTYIAAQTPQVFRYDKLLEGYELCFKNNIQITDEASAIEMLKDSSLIVVSIEGDRKNIKVTIEEDIKLVNSFLLGSS